MTPSTPAIRASPPRKRRGDHRRARERKELVLRADEDLHPLAGFRAVQEVDHLGLGLEVGEQQADALEVLVGAQLADEMGLAAHDQLFAPPAARPRGKARVDESRRERVDLAARSLARALDIRPRFR